MLKKLVVGKSKNRLKYQSIYIKLAVQLFGESKISSRMNLKNVQLPPPPHPPSNILLSLQYINNFIGKIIQDTK